MRAADADPLDLWLAGADAGEVVACALASIERRDPALNAVLTVMADDARQRASDLDERLAGGGSRLPLHGMPITIKDNVDVAGVPTTVASDFFRDRVAADDAEVVRRLRAAGAVIVGKANLHEFALGATGQSPHLGPCRNPWDPERVPGGSSSGSAASVAAGLCVASIGSDTGGSIRNPAAFNNLVGLKATHGRVPNRGSFPVSPSFDVLGPLARRVEEAAAVYLAVAGYDPLDPTSHEREVGEVASHLARGIRGAVIGVPRSYYHEDLDDGVGRAVEEAERVLRDLGARLVEVDLPGAAEAWRVASRVLVMADAAALHRERMEQESLRMGADVFARVSVGREVSGMDYADGMRFREAWRVVVARALATCDVLAMPTCPIPPPPVAGSADTAGISNRINQFNFTWSLAGVPALSLPCGFADGLPVGLQIVGRWWQEGRVLGVGAAYQRATDWHRRLPPAA